MRNIWAWQRFMAVLGMAREEREREIWYDYRIRVRCREPMETNTVKVCMLCGSRQHTHEHPEDPIEIRLTLFAVDPNILQAFK